MPIITEKDYGRAIMNASSIAIDGYLEDYKAAKEASPHGTIILDKDEIIDDVKHSLKFVDNVTIDLEDTILGEIKGWDDIDGIVLTTFANRSLKLVDLPSDPNLCIVLPLVRTGADEDADEDDHKDHPFISKVGDALYAKILTIYDTVLEATPRGIVYFSSKSLESLVDSLNEKYGKNISLEDVIDSLFFDKGMFIEKIPSHDIYVVTDVA